MTLPHPDDLAAVRAANAPKLILIAQAIRAILDASDVKERK